MYCTYYIVCWGWTTNYVSRKLNDKSSLCNEKPTCPKCNKVFSTKSSMKRRMQFHTGQFRNYCDICRKGFADVTNYREHMRSHEGSKYQCQYCSKVFVARKTYKYLKSFHTGQYRFRCNKCGTGFNEKIKFDRHQKFHSS